jgi:hypothetical protein
LTLYTSEEGCEAIETPFEFGTIENRSVKK